MSDRSLWLKIGEPWSDRHGVIACGPPLEISLVGPRPYVAGLKHSAESPRPPERSTNSGAAIWCR